MDLELKRDENPGVILNNLYKFTKLQSTFGVINLAIVHGGRQVLPLKDLLRHFVDFRREVVVRRTQYDLRRPKSARTSWKVSRSRSTTSTRVISDHPSEQDARRPRSPAASLPLQRCQAQAILDMRLQRLTGLERAEDRRRIRRDAQAHRAA
jgi:DNA gyrase subunit A